MEPMTHGAWPAVNAGLNACSAVLLAAGWGFIRGRRQRPHIACMVAACAVSAAFLVSYLLYHAQVGSVKFTGTGWSRPVYFAILISHTVLAMVIAPMAVRTVWLGARRRYAGHTALGRWTLPLWLYVSVTGVIVYVMLYQMNFQ